MFTHTAVYDIDTFVVRTQMWELMGVSGLWANSTGGGLRYWKFEGLSSRDFNKFEARISQTLLRTTFEHRVHSM